MGFLAWLEATGLGTWVRESNFGYPIVLAAHSVGMGVVVGIILMLSARVLGFAKRLPVNTFEVLFTVAWVGFAVNAISGVLLFLGNASHLAVNAPFLIKIFLVAVGGIAAWALANALRDENGALVGENWTGPTSKAKALAVANILIWCGAVLAGRLIGYTISYF